jgi:GAF domain-containing protein
MLPRADQRFAKNPLPQGPNGLRFYVGAPLLDPHAGQTVGAVCVADFKPREATSDAKRNILVHLSHVAAEELS